LRKCIDNNKLAILYEVVAEDTSEEGTSQRRRGSESRKEPRESISATGRSPKGKAVEKPKLKPRQLEILSSQSLYEVKHSTTPKAAESPAKWGEDDAPVDSLPD
jgi:hypothetical protein